MDDKKLYKSPDKKICGVCAGIADYFNIDPTLVRLIAVAIALYSVGLAVLVYLVLALAIDSPPDNYHQIYQNTSTKLTKSANKRIAGVCGGLAKMLNIDPVIVRIAWGGISALTALIPGLALYILAAVIMPKSQLDQAEYDYQQQQYQQYQQYQQQQQQQYHQQGDKNNNH